MSSERSLSVIPDKVLRSSDGTSVKLVQITKREGLVTIESGRYEVDGESILCLSSQIGCAMKCQFCRSTEPFEFVASEPKRMLRNLTAEEIVDQATNAIQIVPIPPTSKGMVFSYMGMGEPFANIKAVKESIISLGTKYPQARATISTIGFNLKGITELADEVSSRVYPIPIKLHISLHGSSDEQRKQIIPYALPIIETLSVAESFALKTQTEVKLNYVLVSGFNDGGEDANRLSELLKGKHGLVIKLSDLNSEDEALIVSSEKADQFEKQLNNYGIRTCRFTSMGKDIKAGCGELVKGKK